MDGLEWGMAAAMLLGIPAGPSYVEAPDAVVQVATEPIVRKRDPGDGQRPPLRVSGLPRNGEAMMRGDWARQ